MNDSTMQRLSRLVTDKQPEEETPDQRRFRFPSISLKLDEGYFSLVLLAIVIFTVNWSIQSSGWVPHIYLLSLFSLLGLLLGVIFAKWKWPKLWVVHPLVVVLGGVLAYWQTANAIYRGSWEAFAKGLGNWLLVSSQGGTADDAAIFLLMIIFLGYLLAYASAFLIYRVRLPWMVLLINGIVLIVNVMNQPPGAFFYVVIYVIAGLLLVMRLNLHLSFQRWHRLGLRWADDLGWDVMQVGALISIGMLIFSWVMPGDYRQEQLANYWDGRDSPWTALQNTWNRLISVRGGTNQLSRGSFAESLNLGGDPNLAHELVYLVTTDGSSDAEYLQLVAYDAYSNGWAMSPTVRYNAKANELLENPHAGTVTVKQTIKIINPPKAQQPYIGGASRLMGSNLESEIQRNPLTGDVMAWIGKNGVPLAPGATYTVVSSVSVASAESLRKVLTPQEAAKLPEKVLYSSEMLTTYTQLPSTMNPAIKQEALSITRDAQNMYDKVRALEQYFKTNYKYNTHIERQYHEDGVSWLLFNNPSRTAFCNYFASALAVMARTLGLPARVVSGYTPGTYEKDSGSARAIYGTDAHAWAQVFFPEYGWINFEPSPGFAGFTRPEKDATTGNATPVATSGAAGATSTATDRPDKDLLEEGSFTNTQSNNQTGQLTFTVFGFVGAFLALLVLAFWYWWQQLFTRLGLASQFYGRLGVLASWGGIPRAPSLTPYEYADKLAERVDEKELLERITDIYVRDRWADPESEEHPRKNGEIRELPGLWRRLQPNMVRYVLRHPHFLKAIPEGIAGSFRWMKQRLPRWGGRDEED